MLMLPLAFRSARGNARSSCWRFAVKSAWHRKLLQMR